MGKLRAAGCDPSPTGKDSYESHCPAHREDRKNLSVKLGDNGAVILGKAVDAIACHLKPTKLPDPWTFRTPHGDPIMAVARFDTADGEKTDRPFQRLPDRRPKCVPKRPKRTLQSR